MFLKYFISFSQLYKNTFESPGELLTVKIPIWDNKYWTLIDQYHFNIHIFYQAARLPGFHFEKPLTTLNMDLFLHSITWTRSAFETAFTVHINSLFPPLVKLFVLLFHFGFSFSCTLLKILPQDEAHLLGSIVHGWVLSHGYFNSKWMDHEMFITLEKISKK